MGKESVYHKSDVLRADEMGIVGYVDGGTTDIDNKAIERKIRPIASNTDDEFTYMDY